ncbi:MAG: glycoside hydrolase family 95 protein [Oscillospiraceae bacterium]|nr:glycoside hydrolase family 95 protein [Oscillospiraceae bacterium]MCL2278713.1 glycoside hydrolase family 95 protein [Oscillospiraceae bacterium]
MYKLWYDKPASIWEEALPLGNGRIGAMIWSGVTMEKISLNEDSLWSGYPQEHNIPDAAKHYIKARDLALSGKYLESQNVIEQQLLSRFTQSYLPLGELQLHFSLTGKVTDYNRTLDLSTALSKATYTQDDITFTRECFISAEDQALVMKISSNKAGAVSFSASFTCQLQACATSKGTKLILDGIAPSEVRPSYVQTDSPIIYEAEPSKRGMGFIVCADFEAENGVVAAEGGTINVADADSVVIRLCTRTSYNGPFCSPYLAGKPYEDNCRTDLDAAMELDYQTLYERHLADYRNLYNRVEIDFGLGKDNQPIPERIAGWENSEEDPSLFALLFQYGRYLMISGSREGTLPTNLQGIWNQHLQAPWSANYTININTEMNYWPAEVTNLSECHEPLLSFLQTLRTTGAKTARIHYGAAGFVTHHNTDIWGLSNPVGEGGKGNASYAFWALSAGWLSSHAFEHYAYTLDIDFLENQGWPVIRDAARFYLDVMAHDSDGTLVFAPSTSPENSFIHEGKRCPVHKNTTMSTAVIKETLTNAVKCCDILGVEPQFKEEAIAALKKMPAYKIGSRGELLEWSDELPEAEPEHRHNSHLYPLHPGHDISLEHTPELANACKRTLELRGEESTGWALAWRINLWARLAESERAFALLKKQVRPVGSNKTYYSENGGCYPNLFGGHPPFQIDSNYGACAGIAELLLQSREDSINLLPALPKALKNGFVKGLRARGGVTVDIEFFDGKVKKAILTLDARMPTREIALRYNGKDMTVTLEEGKKVIVV